MPIPLTADTLSDALAGLTARDSRLARIVAGQIVAIGAIARRVLAR